MDSFFKEKIFDKSFDVLIIGGGITGAGIALDAQSRGLSTCLLEMQDFAQGTSSRSTKLIHGGLRYLKQLNFSLVKEVGKERQILHNNARHLVLPLDVVLPILKDGSLGQTTTKIAMYLYEKLAGVKDEDLYKFIEGGEMLDKYPEIDRERIRSGIQYLEYATNDARLVIEIIKKATELGAAVANYTKVTSFVYYGDGRVHGVKAVNTITNEEKTFYAERVINATGPWVDRLCYTDNMYHEDRLVLTKGVHIVLSSEKLPLHEAFYFDTPDKRMVFVIPKYDKTYIGTTDTFYYKQNIKKPEITQEDAQYLIDAVNNLFDYKLTLDDVESGWAGVRPLIGQQGKKTPSEISRKDEIFTSKSGLISIAGGKLTGYRLMAKKAVDMITKKECVTENLRLSGGEYENDQEIIDNKKQFFTEGIRLGLKNVECEMLFQLYGKNGLGIFEHHYRFPKKHKDYHLPLFVFLALDYSVRYEFVYSIDDFYTRRTDWFYFYIELVKSTLNEAVHYMEDHFHWTKEEKMKQLEVMRELIEKSSKFDLK
ncbi:MAG: glycerol-3-phosphate dehydrogenase/oxidase [Cytophagales bacterium]|nr:glycerol-3-phosphate dehydrogenase/oxidase [Cytophagales bacterium]